MMVMLFHTPRNFHGEINTCNFPWGFHGISRKIHRGFSQQIGPSFIIKTPWKFHGGFGNNVERNFVLSTNSKQTKMLNLLRLCQKYEIIFRIVAETRNNVAETGNIVAKNGNIVKATFDFVERTKLYDKIVRHCFWQQSRMLLRHCC